MPKPIILDLTSLQCNESCWGPGADKVVMFTQLWDSTDRNNPKLLIKNVSPVFTLNNGDSGKAQRLWVVPVPLPNPDRVTLDMSLVKVEDNLPPPLPLPQPPPPAPTPIAPMLFNPGALIVNLLVNAVTSLVDRIAEFLLEGTLGYQTDTVTPNAAHPNHEFTLNATGHGSNYVVKYTLWVG
jgi:hypothetical protein